jgi:alkanesulfonate monooxygenase SsuD/methylene tetrahydromethanopterin reductase-like flavin-dependent oxidoreductase (luciferase family)
MEYGAHLPLIELEGRVSLEGLRAYARAAEALGYRYLCANDHLLFSRPWLDGPTALAAVLADAPDVTLATTVSLPVVRGPVQLAKTLTAIDLLSEGRLVVGVGPGSSARDYEVVGVPFAERWRRFDEAIQALRHLLSGETDGFEGAFYSTAGVELEPRAVRRTGPPLWVASWGSTAGLRRAARLGDGWLASAYNTTPDRFRAGLGRVSGLLGDERAGSFANAVATAWMYITEDADRAERMLTDVLAPMLNRPVEALRALALPIGPAEVCAERIGAFADAGAQRIFLWPLGDEVTQLELFRDRVAPLVQVT